MENAIHAQIEGRKKESAENSELSTLVPGTGFEPAHLAAPPPEDGASTNFATRAALSSPFKS